jgi:hypothetical protein
MERIHALAFVHVTERQEPWSFLTSPILRPRYLFERTSPRGGRSELQLTRGATCDEADSTLIVGFLRWLLSVTIDCPFQDDVNLSNRLREYLVDEMEGEIDSLSRRRQRQ